MAGLNDYYINILYRYLTGDDVPELVHSEKIRDRFKQMGLHCVDATSPRDSIRVCAEMMLIPLNLYPLFQEVGWDVNHQYGERRVTALHMAVAVCSLRRIAALLRMGADPNIDSRHGPPLAIAMHTNLRVAHRGHRLAIVRLLVNAGARDQAKTLRRHSELVDDPDCWAIIKNAV